MPGLVRQSWRCPTPKSAYMSLHEHCHRQSYPPFLSLWIDSYVPMSKMCNCPLSEKDNIGTPAKASWILYVTVAISILLTRVSLTLVWVSGFKWLSMVIYGYNQYTKRLFCLSAIQLCTFSEWFSLHSVLLVKKQIRLSQRQSSTLCWLSVCTLAYFNV